MAAIKAATRVEAKGSLIFLKLTREYQIIKAIIPKKAKNPERPVSPRALKKSLSVDSASVKSSIFLLVKVE